MAEFSENRHISNLINVSCKVVLSGLKGGCNPKILESNKCTSKLLISIGNLRNHVPMYHVQHHSHTKILCN